MCLGRCVAVSVGRVGDRFVFHLSFGVIFIEESRGDLQTFCHSSKFRNGESPLISFLEVRRSVTLFLPRFLFEGHNINLKDSVCVCRLLFSICTLIHLDSCCKLDIHRKQLGLNWRSLGPIFYFYFGITSMSTRDSSGPGIHEGHRETVLTW